MDPKSPKLSLLAQFDDAIRMNNSSNKSIDEVYVAQIYLLENFEKYRKLLCAAYQRCAKLEEKLELAQTENRQIGARLESTRRAYTKEIKERKHLEQELEDNRKTILKIQSVLNKEHLDIDHPQSQVFSILSDFSRRLPPPVAKLNETNESDDGLLFDKSEETLEDLDRSVVKVSSAEAPVETTVVLSKISEENSQTDTTTLHNDVSTSTPISSSCLNVPTKTSNIQKSMSVVSISMNRRRSSRLMNNLNTMRSASKLVPERLDSRAHTFQQKKAFKSVDCSACTKSIGFCSSCMICIDCRAVVHQRCQDYLPKPCIPYVANKAGLHKMVSGVFSGGHMVMISDFTSQNERPSVPALLIHCCNEIMRRIDLALQDGNMVEAVTGVYQSSASEREVCNLRGKILECKAGLPNLTTLKDINLICGVILAFLRDLDDPIVTRILWNDFVRASEHVEKLAGKNSAITDHSDYGSGEHCVNEINQEDVNWASVLQVLKGVVVQLPNANRDSLAFLFIHFHRLLDAKSVTKIDIDSLVKIFAPSMVGTSQQRFRGSISRKGGNGNRMVVTAETAKQEAVLNSLLRLPVDFWEGLLKDPNFCPFDMSPIESKPARRSLNQSMIQKISHGNLLHPLNSEIDSKSPDPLY